MFDNALAALRYLHSPDGGALTKLAHTQVMRAAKTDGTRDGWAFTMKKPLSSPGAAVPPPLSSRATASLSPFFLVPVRCTCCGANFFGTKYSCHRYLACCSAFASAFACVTVAEMVGQ